MPRTARIIIPNFPHHVTQRGNRSQKVFFSEADKGLYLALLAKELRSTPVRIWAYCLMDNHVHFVAVPSEENDLARLFGEVHKKYSQTINKRNGWKGYLWQGRFGSCVMDERHLYAAARYVENNPVKAGLVDRAEDYPWSSAAAHVKGVPDRILSKSYLAEEIRDWGRYLREREDEEETEKIRYCAGTGRPCGDDAFVDQLEYMLQLKLFTKPKGRRVRTQK